MNFLLVAFTMIVLLFTMVGVAMLASDRVFPLGRTAERFAEDGVEIPEARPRLAPQEEDGRSVSTENA